jgi:hypothetical protein
MFTLVSWHIVETIDRTVSGTTIKVGFNDAVKGRVSLTPRRKPSAVYHDRLVHTETR